MNAPKRSLMTLFILALVFSVNLSVVQATDTVERSYHGQLGRSPALGGWGNGLGMLEKWCALPNFVLKSRGGSRDGRNSAVNVIRQHIETLPLEN